MLEKQIAVILNADMCRRQLIFVAYTNIQSPINIYFLSIVRMIFIVVHMFHFVFHDIKNFEMLKKKQITIIKIKRTNKYL